MPPTTKQSELETSEQPGADLGPLGPDSAPIPDPTASATHALAPSAAAAHPTAPAAEPRTPALGVMAAGDRCANCGAPMAPDQRYCLECGERRGQARFAAPAQAGTAATTTAGARSTGQSRFSSGTALIAGIATLLLAMGIGVLIGRSGNSTPAASNSKVQVVNLGASGGSASTAPSTATSAPANSAGAASSSSGKGSKSAHHSTAAHASASSSGGIKTVKAQPPPTVTVGAKGSGAGYQGGHFTGNFFGGGG